MEVCLLKQQMAKNEAADQKRKNAPSFGIDIVKSKKLLKYVSMQKAAETSFSSNGNSPVFRENYSNVYLCLACSEEFETMSLLNIHQWDHAPTSAVLNVKCFTCIRCSKSYIIRHCFLQHVKTCHSNTHFCKYCRLSFDNFAALKHHTKVKHTKDMLAKANEVARFICAFCPACYYTANLLISHLKRHHSKQTSLDEYYPKCEVVEAKEVNQNSKRHKKTKSTYETACETDRVPLKCLPTLNLQISPGKDMKACKSASKYSCSHCNIKFFSTISMQEHQRQCHKIGKVFQPIFGCGKCSAKFFKNSFLRRHLVNHHGTHVTPKI